MPKKRKLFPHGTQGSLKGCFRLTEATVIKMKKTKKTARGKNQQGSGSRGVTIVILLLLAAIVAGTATVLYVRPDWRWLVTDALFSSPAGTMPRGEDADALRARGGKFSELSSFTVGSLRDDPRVTENASLMLINPEHLLSADYQPMLAPLPDSDMLADPQLCLAFAALAAECEERTGAAQKLIITSAYRTRKEQEAAISEEGERAQALAKPVVNMLTNEAAAYMNAHAEFDIEQSPLTPQRLTSLVEAVASDEISSKQGKEVLVAIIEEDKDPAAIIDERGMKQVSDTGALEAVVDAVIAENPGQVEKYKSGNTKVIGFFVGQCMKQMKGQGNPKLLNELLAKKLSE